MIKPKIGFITHQRLIGTSRGAVGAYDKNYYLQMAITAKGIGVDDRQFYTSWFDGKIGIEYDPNKSHYLREIEREYGVKFIS